MSNKQGIVEKKVFKGNMFGAFNDTDSEEEEEEVLEQKEEVVNEKNITKEQLTYQLTEENDDYGEGWTDVKRKHDVDLIYGKDSWQYKVITNRLIFEDDNQSVLEVFEMKRLYYKFKKAKNNYYRNKLLKKMMWSITNDAWNSIKNMVIEKPRGQR